MNGYIMFPKKLMEPQFTTLSPEAKLLFSFMLDRCSLSKSNGDQWEYHGETFIYFSLKEIAATFGWCHDKSTRMLRELQDHQLIRRTRQGLGKPDRIFVNDALLPPITSPSNVRKYRNPEYCDPTSNNTDTIHLELIQTDPPLPRDRRIVEAVIKTRINYDVLCTELTVAYLDPIIELMVDTICSNSDTIIIGGAKRCLIDVCERFLALDDLHIRYIYGIYMKQNTQIHSPRGFLLKLLYDAAWAVTLP